MTPKLQVLQRTLNRLLRRGAVRQLRGVLAKTHTADLAELLPGFSAAHRQRLLEACGDLDQRAEVIACADSELAGLILADSPVRETAALLSRLEPDDASDILEAIPADRADQVLAQMRADERSQVEELARYDSASAGGIMSPRFFSLHRDVTAAEAIAHLQEVSEDLEMVFYLYVVNEIDQLLGVVSLRQLVTTKPTTTLFDLMTADVLSVTADVDQEEVAALASRYGLLAVPVVDAGNKLIGIVTVDDVIDVLREEATEDILRMVGAGDALAVQANVGRSLIDRLPWVFVVAIGGALGGLLLQALADPRQWWLLLLVPLVIGVSGQAGGQAATIVAQRLVQGLGAGKLSIQLARQALIAVSLGGLFGGLSGVVFWIALRDAVAALSVGLGVAAAIASAALAGATLPITFARIRIDPTIAAGPIGAIFLDLVGLGVYLLVQKTMVGG